MFEPLFSWVSSFPEADLSAFLIFLCSISKSKGSIKVPSGHGKKMFYSHIYSDYSDYFGIFGEL
jgi:hypothetical protein